MLEVKNYQLKVKEDACTKVQGCFYNLKAMFDDIQSKRKDADCEIDGVIDTYRNELKTIEDFINETKNIIEELNDNIAEIVDSANKAEKRARDYYGWFTSESDKNKKLMRKLLTVRDTLDLLID